MAGTQTIDVKGNWSKSGTFTAGTGTVTFNGSPTQNITGSATTFYTLAIASGSQVNLNGFTHPATYLTLAGNGKAIGTWGSTSSAASNTNDTYFTGTGVVNVTTGAPCSAPTITLGSILPVCAGVISADLSYSVTTNGPDRYSIVYSAAAQTAGFVNVTNAELPATPITLVVPGAAAAATYTGTLTVKNSFTGCISGSYLISVTINPLPQGSLSANTICAGGTGQLTYTSTSGTGPFSLIINGVTYDEVVSGTPFNVTTNPTETTVYSLSSIQGTNCTRTTGITGATATITVNALPAITGEPGNQSITYGADASFTVAASNATGYQWEEYNGTAWNTISNGGIYSTANTATLTLTRPTVSLSGRKYRCLITGGCGTVYSDGEAELTITKLTINVAAVAKTKVYGESDPALTYTFSPALIGSDAFTGSLDRTPGESVGDWAINQGTLALSGDYTLAYTGADLTITKKALTITANNITKEFNTTYTILGTEFTTNGLVNGDAVTSATITSAGTAQAATVGNHTIAISAALGTGLANYQITYQNGIMKVQDTQAPNVVCRATPTIIYLNESGIATLTGSQIDGGTTDPSGFTLSVSKGSFVCGEVGNHNITLTATDPYDNWATCVAVVTVQDKVLPLVTKPANVTQPSLGACTISIPLSTIGTATATDNCGIHSIQGTRQDGKALTDESPVGITKITWTASDVNGNISLSSDQIITVTGNITVTIACTTLTPFPTDAGQCDKIIPEASITAPNIITGCGEILFMKRRMDNLPFDAAYPKGNTTIRRTALTRGFVYLTECDQTVTVVDNQNPVIACVSNQAKETDPDMCTYTVVGTEFNPTSFSDNCPGATISNDFNSTATLAGAVFPKGITTVVWTVTDASGNKATCSFDVVVSDKQAPVLTGTPYAGTTGTDACKVNAANAAPFNATIAIEGYSDNCGAPVTATLTGTNVTGTDCNWIVTYTFSVTDEINSVLVGQTYSNTGSDNTAPTWTTAAGDPDETVECSDAAGIAAAQALFPVASDLCDVDVADIVKVPGIFVAGTDCSQAGTITNTWTVTDDCGNTSLVYTQVITIEDNTAPSITCPTAQTFCKLSGNVIQYLN